MNKKSDLERTEELSAFLQGEIPEGCHIARSHIPKLTADQAWTVIWYLGNQYWQVPDHVDRCDVCGTVYDDWEEGACLDYGTDPYNFCEACMEGDVYARKAARDPDKTKPAQMGEG